MERMTGVEPASKAWEAFVLPMNYIRKKRAFWTQSFSLACIRSIHDRRPIFDTVTHLPNRTSINTQQPQQH